MLKCLPVLLLMTSCQALGIKSSDTIEQAEIKVIHVINHDAEVPYSVSPIAVKS